MSEGLLPYDGQLEEESTGGPLTQGSCHPVEGQRTRATSQGVAGANGELPVVPEFESTTLDADEPPETLHEHPFVVAAE